MKKIIFSVWLVSCLFLNSLANAGYVGPSTLVSGSWGNGDDQFSFQKGQLYDRFAQLFTVMPDGNIIVADKKFKVYKNNIYQKSLQLRSGLTWFCDTGVIIRGIDILYGMPGDANTYYYDFQGNLIKSFPNSNILGTVQAVLSDCNLITMDGQKTYRKYTPSGQLIQTYKTRSLELGVIEEKERTSVGYRLNITYPDRIYNITLSRQPPDTITRDKNANLYTTQRIVDVSNTGTSQQEDIQHYRITRFSICGKVVGQLDLPTDKYELLSNERFRGVQEQTLEEYGEPLILGNSDVYAWKRTPDKYSILKWTWVDDPNVPTGPEPPTNLSLTPSINGLYLTWKASPNDPGCVTKYEIARATTSGGVFSTIDTVEKGVLKYNDTTAEIGTTYYYKVRAMAGSDPSLYTAEVYGKR